MNTQKLLRVLFALIFIAWFWSCNNSGGSTSSSSDPSDGDSQIPVEDEATPIDPSEFTQSVAETADTYDPADIAGAIAYGHTVTIDFTEFTAKVSSGAAQTITSEGVILLSNGGLTVRITATEYGVTIDSTLDANIIYTLTGVLTGTLTVNSDNPYQLLLNGVSVSGTDGPALDLESNQKAYLVTAPDTVNYLADSADRTMTMKAALYGKGPMIFSGNGTLKVTGSYKHGIFSKDYIRVRGGALDVTVDAKDAVRAVNGFIFDDGELIVNALGTTTDDESKGIKVEGEEGSDGAGKGFVVINGGHITITSVGKAITAGWDIDEDAETADRSDDPNPYVEINSGVIIITTTGTPYEYMSGGETVSCSPEGIEGKAEVIVNNGYMIINTTDDAVNAGDAITINGGYLFCKSSQNDAIDSNGTLTIAGGVIVAIGAGVPEGAFDCDQNTFAITGGTFAGIGGALSQPTEFACTQNAVILGSKTAGSTLALKAQDGTVVFAFTIPQSYSKMLLSTPDIGTGTSYTVYTGGTVSADYVFEGLYLDSIIYSQGTAGESFTVSSYVTNLDGGR